MVAHYRIAQGGIDAMDERYRDKSAFFDRLAPEWADKDFDADEAPKVARLLAACDLQPGMTVLEPGCGAGRLTRRLARAVGPTGRVIACDVSPAMADACRRANPDPHVEVHAAAVEDLGLAPASLDRVVCFAVFPHVADQGAALGCFARWLKPQGLLVICHFMSAAELNEFHRHAAPTVAHDRLPPLSELGPMLTCAGLVTEIADDEPGWLFVRARPK